MVFPVSKENTWIYLLSKEHEDNSSTKTEDLYLVVQLKISTKYMQVQNKKDMISNILLSELPEHLHFF